MKCPLCNGEGYVLRLPKDLELPKKVIIAHNLKEAGLSIREIMKAMNYKSPRSVSCLLEKKPEKLNQP